MSVVYEKSISQKYKKYFEQISDLTQPFSEYSIKNQAVIKKDTKEVKSWEEGGAGVPIAWNRNEDKVAIDHTDSHTLIIGPTGSKKSRLVIMPMIRILGSANESMIISDPKAEVYNRTASYLKHKGYEIFVLNLRSPLHGSRWNPLAIPYEFFCRGDIDKAYEFVNDIAQNLIQSEKSENDPFWDNSAGSLFFGLVLLLFKYCTENHMDIGYVHIGNVIQLRNILFSESNVIGRRYLWDYAKTDSIISSALIGTVETASSTQAGILSVFDQKVRVFAMQPTLLDMLSYNDINFDAIGKKATAIFLIVPDEKTGYHALVSLFIKQSYEYIIYKAQLEKEMNGFNVGKLSNRVNYVLDEFSSLPTIHDFPAMITASRSRNIRFTLVIQSKHQLIQRYREEAETIQTNCNNWMFFTSRELRMLEDISALCGKTSVDNSKPVLSVSMLQRLDKDKGEVLLLCGRMKPCISTLPDIEFYDKNHFRQVNVFERKMESLKTLDSNFFDTSRVVEDISDKYSREKLDVNALIQKIDDKIAELEEENELKKRSALNIDVFENDERS